MTKSSRFTSITLTRPYPSRSVRSLPLNAWPCLMVPPSTSISNIPVGAIPLLSIDKKAYVVDPGHDEIQIGASSSDIRQTCAVTVQ